MSCAGPSGRDLRRGIVFCLTHLTMEGLARPGDNFWVGPGRNWGARIMRLCTPGVRHLAGDFTHGPEELKRRGASRRRDDYRVRPDEPGEQTAAPKNRGHMHEVGCYAALSGEHKRFDSPFPGRRQKKPGTAQRRLFSLVRENDIRRLSRLSVEHERKRIGALMKVGPR